ncbi:hypothetical protein THAOC_20302 [Thalassiosira oceanica]|uniref:Uncharacterized protein n=1 Tax=Thalassiosira oceanica TaxID=159749 RepID=K0SLW9_THAOC|nr:hypothetical protein THAOC_20302 [Thalassiosira oceanica]|eukprot:EJK59472.1 hypothetical protein THAOC_20302 [Thalassiosira oceanica]
MDAVGDDYWDIGPDNEFIKAEMQRLLWLQQFITEPENEFIEAEMQRLLRHQQFITEMQQRFGGDDISTLLQQEQIYLKTNKTMAPLGRGELLLNHEPPLNGGWQHRK